MLVYNLIAKLVISDYAWFNLGLSSLVLCSQALLLYILNSSRCMARLRIGMSVFYVFIGLLLFIISQFSLVKIVNNKLILILAVAYGVEWLVYGLLRVANKIAMEQAEEHTDEQNTIH